ncbi:MAG: sugar nucleotide-binding protein [Gemmatimonadetes bacterium]|nr:sugar nucleotide-binding protein [Gemmatimonadota bacterium]
MRARAAVPLELWGGVECTVNRVGDHYLDQVERTGHGARLEDLQRFAELGIRAMRYPVLWERMQPVPHAEPDWAWSDTRLQCLREAGVRPIVGLVHHGSGPRHTSLVDPSFATGLAAYARAVAERYPWVADYTPVNEPLTTARFSGMYGYWYPHGHDGRTFARALIVQCRAISLAMREIRAVNPAARLLQTEDLGKTHGTPRLAYQARFENHRRWWSFDLLCGRVDRGHPLWDYLRWVGISERELSPFLEEPCPPDVLGVNHYLTSERFLDERLHRYPRSTHGGNGRDVYADVEAVRVLAGGPAGLRSLLREAWRRYRIPLAVTEAHLGCTREEQMRWFADVWHHGLALRRDGVDLRAVTAWSLLGAFDWSSLVTRTAGEYEPGAFDVRATDRPRATALARMLPVLAAGRTPHHPVLDQPGWWHRPDRLSYPPYVARNGRTARILGGQEPQAGARTLLVTGAAGALGSAFVEACRIRGLTHHALARPQLDIMDAAAVEAFFTLRRPWAVVNAAGFSSADAAEREPEGCWSVNVGGASILAHACARHGTALVTFSSDLVFDGARAPYRESDPPSPASVLGGCQAEAEALVRAALPSALVVRTAALFGAPERASFLTESLEILARGGVVPAAADVAVSPTYVPDVVRCVLDLLIDGEAGVWHLVNPGAITWAELARKAAVLAGLDGDRVEPRPAWSLARAGCRAGSTELTSERGLLLPSLEHALERWAQAADLRRRFAALSSVSLRSRIS